MGEKLEKKLGHLTLSFSDIKVQTILRDYLKSLPDVLAEKPASSSGKHHNPKDNAIGGLVWHTRTISRVAATLIEAMGGGPQYDHIRIAAIIHDLGKYGRDGTSSHTVFEHPILGGEMFREFTSKKRLDTKTRGLFADVVRLVERHHGRYVSSKYSKTVLPKAERVDELLLHFADMVSAAPYADFLVDEHDCIPGEIPF